VEKVRTEPAPGGYTFAVTLRTPDTGCDHYADWWEVTDAAGKRLLYRRILWHSHTNEQPFTRRGGPAPVGPETQVVVRLHMHPEGYSPFALKGSVQSGFFPIELPKGFGAALEKLPPQPEDCWF
jgi:hypothetical protein